MGMVNSKPVRFLDTSVAPRDPALPLDSRLRETKAFVDVLQVYPYIFGFEISFEKIVIF